MKMKKLVSALLAIAVTSSAAAFSAYAASPISQGSEALVFEQNFGGLSGAEELTDFDVTGTWHYFEDYMAQTGNYNCNGGVITKSSYDFSEYDWTYDLKLLSNSNGYNIYLGWDEANGKGYRFYQNNSKQTIWLYKAGVEEAVATESLSSTFGKVLNCEISFMNGKLSIVQNGTEVLSYKAAAADFNGKFGAQAAAGSMFILFNMELTKRQNISVNHWSYDEDFTGETIESLKAKGWTLQDGASLENTYLNTGKGYTTFAPYGYPITGSFGVKLTAYQGYNSYMQQLVIRGDNGYEYRIYPTFAGSQGNKDTKIAAIVKCSPSASTSKLTVDDAMVTADKTYGLNYNTYTYDVQVAMSEAAVTITAKITCGSETVTMTATDSENPITNVSLVGMYLLNSDATRINKFSLYTLMNEAEKQYVTTEKEIIDKTFSSDDNYNTVTKDGFYGVPDKAYDWSFANYPEYTDEGGLNYSNAGIYYYYDNTGSDYTIETDMYKMYNNSTVYFNMASSSSYYAFEAQSHEDNRCLCFYKVDGDPENPVIFEKIPLGYGETGAEQVSNYRINCDYQEDGSLKITVVFKTKNYDEQIFTTIEATPLVGNNIRLYPGNKGRLQRFRLTTPVTEADCDGDRAVFNPRFYNAEGKAVTKIEDGAVYVKSGAVPLYAGTAAAVLYENGVMKDIMQIDVTELAGNVKLFDVSDAANAKIKLFVFDNSKDLNKVIETVELD